MFGGGVSNAQNQVLFTMRTGENFKNLNSFLKLVAPVITMLLQRSPHLGPELVFNVTCPYLENSLVKGVQTQLKIRILGCEFQSYEKAMISCLLTSFFWLLSHVIYLKLTRVFPYPKLSLNDKIYSYTKKKLFGS